MAVDFATFNSVVPFVINAGFPVLIRGRHGIGKSEVVYQVARDLGLPVVERRASQMTEGDLMGLPSINGDSTRWNAPDWLKRACEEAVCLFLDEVDRACVEVRQGIFELTDSRKLNGWHLHPGQPLGFPLHPSVVRSESASKTLPSTMSLSIKGIG